MCRHTITLDVPTRETVTLGKDPPARMIAAAVLLHHTGLVTMMNTLGGVNAVVVPTIVVEAAVRATIGSETSDGKMIVFAPGLSLTNPTRATTDGKSQMPTIGRDVVVAAGPHRAMMHPRNALA